MLEKEEIPENRHNIIVIVSVLLFLFRIKKLKIMMFFSPGVTLLKTDRPGEYIFFPAHCCGWVAFQQLHKKSSSESDDEDKSAQVVLNFSRHQQNKVAIPTKKGKVFAISR